MRDFNLPKASAFILGSRLKVKHMLSTDTTFGWHKHRENEYIRFFAKEHSLVYCVDGTRSDNDFGNLNDWCLFIGASKSSLKAVFCTIQISMLQLLQFLLLIRIA